MSYDYGRKEISAATGLTGIEAQHIADSLKSQNIDPMSVDWSGAISDARDYSDRYNAVKRYLKNYYAISTDKPENINQQQMREQQMEMQLMDKAGVKKALKMIYEGKMPELEKQQLRERLLSEAPAYNVLMTALYNGTEMPLAKKFLSEQMGIPLQATPQPKPQPVKNASIHVPAKKELTPLSIREKELLNKMEAAIKKKSEPRSKPIIPKTTLLGGAGDFFKKQFKETGTLLMQSTKGTVSDVKRKVSPTTLQLEQRNKAMRARMEPLRLQIEYQNLLRQQQQMEFLKQVSPSPRKQQGAAAGFMAGLFGLSAEGMPAGGMPAGGMPPFQREGYRIESRPRLPKGYRWVKAKKKPEGGLPYTEHKYARPQDAEKFQRETYRNYGYMPQIQRGFDQRTGMPFFVVIKPKGLRKVKK